MDVVLVLQQSVFLVDDLEPLAAAISTNDTQLQEFIRRSRLFGVPDEIDCAELAPLLVLLWSSLVNFLEVWQLPPSDEAALRNYCERLVKV